MEALHEDLYFGLLDFFASFAHRHSLSDSIQLGRIVPNVLSQTGNHGPRAMMKAIPLTWAQNPEAIAQYAEQSAEIRALSLKGDQWVLEIELKKLKFTAEQCGQLAQIANHWGYETDWRNHHFYLRLSNPKPEIRAEQSPQAMPGLPVFRHLTAEETEKRIENLASLPGLKTMTVAHSWQKRPIKAIEVTSISNDRRYSVAKLRLLKPTIFFNARHHANEVSATTASLQLAEFLALDPEGRELIKRINVIIIPMENVDGVATLEELLPNCSNHMLHAARYNAVGAEFYGDYYEDEPRFPEAWAKTRLWRRWLPEMMIDQHGVPDHEWNQPFSGYVPYRFRPFWIPRAFAFVCVPFLDDSSHPNHPLALKLVRELNEAMEKEEDICALNQTLAERYQFYAQNPEPAEFSPVKGEPMLAVPLLDRTKKVNCAVRFPHITKCEIIVEVPDEIARGEQLKLCIKSNRIIQQTMMDALHSPTANFQITPINDAIACNLSWESQKEDI